MSETQTKFQVGQTVTYEKWDGEEGRSYGWFLTTKKAKIVSISYKMENGDIIEEKRLVLVESKSEEPKKS